MSKNSRQTDILNLIKEFEIEKQEELVEKLNSLGQKEDQDINIKRNKILSKNNI